MSNINKIWGERRRILLTDKTEIDLLYLKANTFCSSHNHEEKVNKFYVVSGKIKIETEIGNIILTKNDSWEVHPPLKHRFVALEDSVMIELAYTIDKKIDPKDINRDIQGGKIIDGKYISIPELREKGLLELNNEDS